MRFFKVPRRKFEEGSEVFRDMFAVPPGDNVVEGQTDEHPLLLESISMDEFRSLLRVMFRPHYGPTAEETMALSLDEWIHVLKLTTMWSFDSLRRVAIDNLRPLLEQEDPVQWVTLARKYEVHEWLLPSLHALARRQEALQVDEVEPLGIVTVVKMAEVRERFPFGGNSGNYRNAGYASRATHNFEQEISRVFREEFKGIGPASSTWGGF
ncbi:hypothetical protein LXA43DRAFT_974680 [Ganoderma leucocontextum]|nr:hypothetical protein LXA43DRAFT_974680 [Ganoderma leucocontextum]